MNKLVFFILFLAISFGYIFDIDKVIARNFTPFTSLKQIYIDSAESIKNTQEKYFYQRDRIEELQNENNQLKNYRLKYLASKNELDSILKNLENPNSTTNQIKFTKVLSYVDFDDYTKVWLDMKKVDDSILGVISEEFAAGIVINQDDKAKALLNGNEKCNYAIFIGENKAPGIIHPSKEGNTLIAKYVPIWFDIKEGDEVITSGMDNIFFEGLKVGRIEEVTNFQDMKTATVKPYINVLKKKYFFIYKNIPHIELKDKKIQPDKKIDINN